ncbi:MAG: RNA methyltransferase [Pseudomonadota bacterium]
MSKSRPRNRPESAKRRSGGRVPTDKANWLWGQHAVEAAMANPRRRIKRVLASRNALERLMQKPQNYEDIAPADLSDRLPVGAVHQGIAIEVDPLPSVHLEDLIASGAQRLVVLDQVTDPHNLGAIFRSAAAFGFGGIILQSRNTPPITGVVAKSAAGAIETVAECRVVNIARALDQLSQAGFHGIGLAGEGRALINQAVQGAAKVSIVLGAEGAGLRPGVAKACAELARIPIDSSMESLNVSNAAAIAFYETAMATTQTS